MEIDAVSEIRRRINDAQINVTEKQDNKNDFLLQLAEIKDQLESVSRTNWDVIVVRTAIILLAVLVIGIFQRLLMSAVNERRSWENKLAAMALLSKERLDSSSEVRNFLKIILADPLEPAKAGASKLPGTDVDALVNRLEGLVNPKPPGSK
ncbi:hypothetical protein GCM10007385_35390 [Tateyamaria omphalii]|nr:hypothetical protein GCM10007385_35390 [Tateyamaria omphalii]